MKGEDYVAVVEFGESARGSQTEANQSPAAAPVVSRPAWVLVVPGEALDEGRSLWGRESAWSRSWAAPVRLDGMRLVSTMGDADDRKRLIPSMIANPDDAGTGDAIRWLGQKYGAPAVAMVLREPSGGIRATLWRTGGGTPATSVDDAPGNDPKAAALDMLGDLAKPEPAEDHGDGVAAEASHAPDEQSVSAHGSLDQVDLEEHPEYSQEGLLGFAIVLASEDANRSARIRDAVSRLPGVTVRSADADADGAEVTGTFGGDRAALVAELASIGLSANPVPESTR
jgi:hypothetical protein